MKKLLTWITLCIGIMAAHASWAQTSLQGVGERVFSEVEKAIIDRYLGSPSDGSTTTNRSKDKKTKKSKNAKGEGKGRGKGLPPGLAKRESLPPGLAKRETLPRGLQTRPLPRELEQRLPPPAPGTERVLVDGAAVLIEKATNRVLDILERQIGRAR